MTAYYNEHDPFAAAWLRELIKAGHVAPGIVDERSIEDVKPSELIGYTQCHFFAGIGGWSYALRLAGWPDDRPVWTGSCPCQPFSAAGKGDGFADERHLWPAWFHLIERCEPGVVFGEQVEAAIKHGWLDLVQADLEGIGYAFGAVGIPAAGVGAPHIRQRLWFVADRDAARCGTGRASEAGNGRDTARIESTRLRAAGELADTNGRNPGTEWQQRGGEQRLLAEGGGPGKLVQPGVSRLEGYAGHGDNRHEPGRINPQSNGSTPEAGATRGFWRPADWLPCRDGKARPVEPGTFPLAHGVPARVGRLRGYGNAIVPQVAAEVIRAYMESELLL